MFSPQEENHAFLGTYISKLKRKMTKISKMTKSGMVTLPTFYIVLE